MLRQSPIGAYLAELGAAVTTTDGWQVARSVSGTSRETEALDSDALLVDWSHLGKIIVRGNDAPAVVESMTRLHVADVGRSRIAGNCAVLRLTDDELLIIAPFLAAEAMLDSVDSGQSAITRVTGARAAIALAGPRRHEVLERSAAMNLTQHCVKPLDVVQTSVHRVPCVVWRTTNWDLFLCSRDYGEFLFHALLDAGTTTGLIPGGIDALPVDLAEVGGDS